MNSEGIDAISELIDMNSEDIDAISEGMDSNEWVMERCLPQKNRNATTSNAVRPCDIINFGVKKYVFVGPLKTTDQ